MIIDKIDLNGIIGTLAGTILGSALTLWSKSHGKLRIYFKEPKTTYFKQDSIGCFVECAAEEGTSGASFEVIAQFYNESDSFRVLKDFRIDIHMSSNTSIKKIPKDKRTTRFVRPIHITDDLTIENFNPQQIVEIPLIIHFNQEELSSTLEKAYLLAVDGKNKRIHQRIPI